MVQLIGSAYYVRREGNIIFVCGGNGAADMRTQFVKYCQDNHPEFEVFLPEYAIKNYFSSLPTSAFDIADFEQLISSLSHAVVVFPEAPGSFAEAGYFAAVKPIAKKVILVLDSKFQPHDSFISMGPAKKINNSSSFAMNIQMSYSDPTFEDIVGRINRVSMNASLKALIPLRFRDISDYESFCLIYKIFDLLRIATESDLIYFIRSIFKNRIYNNDLNKIRQLSSILVGAKYLYQIGPFGHYSVNPDKHPLCVVKAQHRSTETSLKLDLAALYSACDLEFRTILDGLSDAA
jgi:hypothetical protein